MDIAVSDKFRAGTHMICNNKITVWRINALTGTYRLVNQTRFCDLVSNWRAAGQVRTVPDEGLFPFG